MASFIFVISLAAAIQFSVFSWRTGLLRIASTQVVNSADPAAAAYCKILESQDFYGLVTYQKVCPELGTRAGFGLKGVSLYFRLLEQAKSLADSFGLSSAGWMGREMGLCRQYAAVVMIQRLERNQELAADLRGF
jgi:hypothetical protein